MPAPFINSSRTFLVMQDESEWAGAPTGEPWLVPMQDGDYGVWLSDPVREQQHVFGDPNSQIMVQDQRDLKGPIKFGLWHHIGKRMLDWITARDADGESQSKLCSLNIPGYEARLHRGCRVESAEIAGSQGGDISISTQVTGRHEEGDTTADLADYDLPTFPSATFKNCRFVISLNAGEDPAAFPNAIRPSGLSAFSLKLTNGLKMGPPLEDRANVVEDGVIEYLTAGRTNLTADFTARFSTTDFSLLQRNRRKARLRVMGANPAYPDYLTVEGGPWAAGASVTISVGEAPTAKNFNVGDYVFFDGGGPEGTTPCVGLIEAVDDILFTITIETLDYVVTTGDHVFNAAYQFTTLPLLVSASPLRIGFDDQVVASISGSIFSGGAYPLDILIKDMPLL